MSPKKKYDEVFKREAVRLVVEEGMSGAQVERWGYHQVWFNVGEEH